MNSLAAWHYDPTVGRLVTALVGILRTALMEFTLRYVVDFKKRRGTQDRLYSRILEEIENSEGRVALASATFHLVETPVLDVRLRDDIPAEAAQ